MQNDQYEFEEADVIFIADMFREEYAGGGELTTDALLQSAPYKTHCIKSSDLTQQQIQQGAQKTWVFFNFRGMDHNLIPFIVQNLHYFVVEYDYKFCQYRSLELHKRETGNDCDCHQQQVGKIISAFYTASEHTFYMSEKQKSIYTERFPFLTDGSSVLSSVFDVKDLEQISKLCNSRKEIGDNGKWAIVDGNSWIKGVDESKQHLDDQGETYEVLGGLSYSDLLTKLSEFKGLVSEPLGHDTCPRLVIEAKLLGLELKLNENVQHSSEEWFDNEKDEIEIYILEGHNRFWNKITNHIERKISLSGYTTTKDVISAGYPWRESIKSLLGFCDEVIVLDGGSTDGTWEELKNMSKLQLDGRLIVKQLKRDWETKRFAIFDGQQKAVARTLCTKDWCWQSDADEIVHEKDYSKVKKLIRHMPKSIKMIALPVTEYWGCIEKVRVDINPWKCRLSRNLPSITHGVCHESRKYDEEGNLFSVATDGCEYIFNDTYETVPAINFYTPQLHNVRMQALEGDRESLSVYEDYMNRVVTELPGVHHYSWFDIKRKIYTYKNYWSKHWNSIFNKSIADTPENNMFFEKRWKDVTDADISSLAMKMKEEMGGWIFHNKIDFNNPTPSIKIKTSQPAFMCDWINEHEEVAK